MNVFSIDRQIRQVGLNYGLPVWVIEFGLGSSYTPEDLLRELASRGIQEKDWIVVKNGLDQKGVGTFVDAIGYVHCRSEVEAHGRDKTPTWFTKADRWTVYYDGSKSFHFGALRRGQDIILSEDLDELVREFGNNDLVDKGYVANDIITPEELEVLARYRIRVYRREDAE